MTSRQPGTLPPGTTGSAPAPRWPALVLPVTALIIVGLAGLRGQVTRPQWDGPWHGDAVAVGVGLEIVLGIMLAISVRRLVSRARAGTGPSARASAVVVTLRRVLVGVLGAGMIAVAVTIPVGERQHLFTRPAGARPGQATGVSAPQATAPGRHFSFHLFSLHLHLTTAVLYGLLALVFLGGAMVRVWWVRQDRPRSGMRAAYHYFAPVPDSQDLLEVVESGRSALRAVDDARAAIIACYVAMEASLAEHGAARVIADTPDELLTRATDMGIVRGTAASRLTALFYEARFSSHPMDRGHRDAAAQALAELAAELAGAQAARTQAAARSRARRNGALA